MNSYICNICDYLHEEEKLPPKCPYCGVPSSHFKLLSEEDMKKIKLKKKNAMVDIVEDSIAKRGYKPPGYSRSGPF